MPNGMQTINPSPAQTKRFNINRPQASIQRASKGQGSQYTMLDGERVMERGENSIALEFSIPEANPYFEGHFPDFPILPGIGQIELIIRFASKYFGTGIDFSEIRRIKFTNVIRPSVPLALKLEKDGAAVSFKMNSPDGGIVYSTGTLKLRENNTMDEAEPPLESRPLQGGL